MRTELRPLGIGEMLDRAVTLSIRYFVPLASIWVAFALPLAFFQYYGTADASKFIANLTAAMDAMSHASSPAAQRSAMEAMSANSVFNGFTVGYLFLLLLVSPLANAALKKSCSDVYLTNRTLPVGEAYRGALKQWLPLIVIALIWVVFGILAYLGVFIVGFVGALVVSLLFVVSKVAGIAITIALVTLLVAAVLVAAVLALLSFEVAFYTQIVEELGFARSFSRGLARVVGRNLGRSIAMGFALLAVELGLTIVALLGQGLIFGVVRSHVLGTVFTVVLGVATAVFIDLFMAIYYYDIRVRTEGLDLQLAAASETSAAPA